MNIVDIEMTKTLKEYFCNKVEQDLNIDKVKSNMK